VVRFLFRGTALFSSSSSSSSPFPLNHRETEHKGVLPACRQVAETIWEGGISVFVCFTTLLWEWLPGAIRDMLVEDAYKLVRACVLVTVFCTRTHVGHLVVHGGLNCTGLERQKRSLGVEGKGREHIHLLLHGLGDY
jgi:hypothetical protein